MFLPIFLRNVKYINFEVENLLPHTIIKNWYYFQYSFPFIKTNYKINTLDTINDFFFILKGFIIGKYNFCSTLFSMVIWSHTLYNTVVYIYSYFWRYWSTFVLLYLKVLYIFMQRLNCLMMSTFAKYS